MRVPCLGITVLAAAVGCASALAQAPQAPAAPAAPLPAGDAPVPLEWTPPALAQLSAQALAKSSFTLDRTMLSAAAGLMGDSDADAKAAVRKLDGVSVHVLHFANTEPADPALVEAIRDGYHLPGWKHVVSASENGRGPVHDAKTDVWVVMDGVNLRGAVILVAGPTGLTLATVAGNLSPVDLLHLRGHFGIPKFDGGALNGMGDK